MSPENPAFSIAERDAVYRAIRERRGICHFVPGRSGVRGAGAVDARVEGWSAA
ncbi:hypothetical protein [Marinobacterium rhizophilum]|uniref:Uncharacterized protein n=1 Tax=Marinobacterium rhizophilum TaxID=420402 RepID=A0ABY5HN81_9GAMM|nr:hypothetical protein [Marinobacterium rhizophilum]UTW12707.1 hypothetical protein KDW95_03235 [Marinobacterium rhizophilum]